MSETKGPLTAVEIASLWSDSIIAARLTEQPDVQVFARALLALAGERVIAALVEEVPCNRNERDGLIRRILGVKHE